MSEGRTVHVRADGALAPSHGRSRHAADCDCPRCVGFEKGNTLGLVHGARSSVERLLPEALPLVDGLRPLVPVYAPSDEMLLRLLGVTLLRVEKAGPAVAAAEEAGELERVESLGRYLRSWVALSAKLLDQLGMSPTARARLGLDIARGASELERYVEHAYPAPVAEHEAVVEAEAVEQEEEA